MFACANHPDGDAAWRCNGCEQYWCGECIVRKRFGRSDAEFCTECGDLAMPVAARITVEDDEAGPTLGSAIGWPLEGSGPLILLGGTLVLCFANLFSPVVGWGIMLGYGMAVIQQSGRGTDSAPEWPDMETWGQILGPAVLALATALLAFGPAVWLAMHEAAPVLVWAAGIAGAAYAPMAWIAASIAGRALAITPITVLPLLSRANASYWVGCAALLGVWVVGNLAQSVLLGLTGPWLGALLGTATTFYLVMVEMRILGLVLRRHREDFGLDDAA